MTTCSFTVKQDGMTVASGSGSREAMIAEASSYAIQYGQDGPVEWTVREGRKTILRGKMTLGEFVVTQPGPQP